MSHVNNKWIRTLTSEPSFLTSYPTSDPLKTTYILNDSFTTDISDFDKPEDHHYFWWYIVVIFLVLAGVTGNVIVILVISLDRKLQNATNYFLLSLSMADLLVSVLVMPAGAIYGFLGKLNIYILLISFYSNLCFLRKSVKIFNIH